MIEVDDYVRVIREDSRWRGIIGQVADRYYNPGTGQSAEIIIRIPDDTLMFHEYDLEKIQL